MKRREFITLLGSAAASWPLAARAQQGERVRRIGVLMGLTESDPEAQSRIAAFRKTLRDLGWTEGRNVRTDYYWAAGDIDRTHALAKELVNSAPDVIVVNTPARIVRTASRDPHNTNRLCPGPGRFREHRRVEPGSSGIQCNRVHEFL